MWEYDGRGRKRGRRRRRWKKREREKRVRENKDMGVPDLDPWREQACANHLTQARRDTGRILATGVPRHSRSMHDPGSAKYLPGTLT